MNIEYEGYLNNISSAMRTMIINKFLSKLDRIKKFRREIL